MINQSGLPEITIHRYLRLKVHIFVITVLGTFFVSEGLISCIQPSQLHFPPMPSLQYPTVENPRGEAKIFLSRARNPSLTIDRPTLILLDPLGLGFSPTFDQGTPPISQLAAQLQHAAIRHCLDNKSIKQSQS